MLIKQKYKYVFLIKVASFLFALLFVLGILLIKYFSLLFLLSITILVIISLYCVKKLSLVPMDIEKKDQVYKGLSYSIVFTVSLAVLAFVLSLNYRIYFSKYLNSNFFDHPYFCIVGFGLYFVTKNVIILFLTKNIKNNNMIKVKKLIKYSILYWLIITLIQAVYYILVDQTIVIKFLLLTIVIYSLIMLIIIYWQYKKVKILSLKEVITKILLIASIGSLIIYYTVTADYWYLQPYISSIPTVETRQNKIVENQDGSYSIVMDGDNFKILQLTDIHLGGTLYTIGEDKNALTAVYDLISHTKPDLIIITGDFVFSVGLFSLSINNYTPIQQFCSFMRNIGIPWAFVYGNHDTEDISTASFEKIDQLFKKYAYKYTKSLLYSEKRPDITGRYNQYIKILNQDETINQILFLLDSNQYLGNMTDYDYIRDNQVKWYKNTLLSLKNDESIPSSMLFFHIPIEEYKEAYRLYKNKSNRVKYYFGEIGENDEAICTSKYSSQLFETAKELGSTKAIFVGHDHYNNISLEYDGIRLTYGRSIDYLAMPGINQRNSQRGGTLITLNSDSSFSIDSIKLDDIR